MVPILLFISIIHSIWNFIVKSIIRTLLNKNFEKFERLLKELYLKQISFNDTKVNSTDIDILGETEQDNKFESFHHGFFLGLFVQIGGNYIIDSNREYGLGRPDIVIIPKDNNKTAFVFEFKWESTKGTKSLDSLANGAIKQIKDKKYNEGIKAKYGHKDIICFGVGFKGKKLKIIIDC